jgi:hypothetical protein
MRYLEEPSRARLLGAPRVLVRWLPVALLAGLVALAALTWQEVASWPVAMAAGALGAVALAGSMRRRTFSDTGALIRQSEAGWAALHAELARSRRHDRRFAIVTIPNAALSAPGSTSEEGLQAGLRAAADVHTLLRRPDRAWTDGSTFHVLLTDCDRQQAWAFLQRARAGMPQLFADARLRLAIFPDDGTTLGALLGTVRSDNVVEALQATES